MLAATRSMPSIQRLCLTEESVPDALGRSIIRCAKEKNAHVDDRPGAGADDSLALALALARRHFASDGVLARVWSAEAGCFWYAAHTEDGLRRCASRQLRGRLGAASILRWDVPVEVAMRTAFVPTEDELLSSHEPSGVARGGGSFVGLHGQWVHGSRPAAFAFGSLFWNVSFERRGYAYAHDAEHTAEDHPTRSYDRRCRPNRSPAEYLSERLMYGYKEPRLWQCHHDEWEAMLREHSAYALHAAALRHCAEYNQAHLSWEAPRTAHGARALFYVNDSMRWLLPERGKAGQAPPPTVPTVPQTARLIGTPEHWPRSTTAAGGGGGGMSRHHNRRSRSTPLLPNKLSRSRALQDAALDAAARAYYAVRFVREHVAGYEGIPIVQLILDPPCDAKPLLQRLAAPPRARAWTRGRSSGESPRRLDVPSVSDLVFRPPPRPTEAAASAGTDGGTARWLGDTDGLGPRTRCNVSIVKMVLGPDDRNFPNFGELWGAENASCWPLPESFQTPGVSYQRDVVEHVGSRTRHRAGGSRQDAPRVVSHRTGEIVGRRLLSSSSSLQAGASNGTLRVASRVGVWRVATRDELSIAMRPEQFDGGDPYERGYYREWPACSAPFRHSCLGACRGLAPGYILSSGHRAATLVYDDDEAAPGPGATDSDHATPREATRRHPGHVNASKVGRRRHPLGGLQRLLAHALTNGSPCSIGFAGDSVVHDLWSASVAGAMRLGFEARVLGVASRQLKFPVRCVCSAGTNLWHALEATRPSSAVNAASYVDRSRGGVRAAGATASTTNNNDPDWNRTATRTSVHAPPPFCASNPSEPGLCHVLFSVSDDAIRNVFPAAANASAPSSNFHASATTTAPRPPPARLTECRTLRMRYHQLVPERHLVTLPAHHRRVASPAEMLEGSTILIHNAGLMHANTAMEADKLLDDNLLPLLRVVAAHRSRAGGDDDWLAPKTRTEERQGGGRDTAGKGAGEAVGESGRSALPEPSSVARLLWLETPPQHFLGGSWQAWRDLKSAVAARGGLLPTKCDPVADREAAAWRNIHFSRWTRQRQAQWAVSQPSSSSSGQQQRSDATLFRTVSFFDALLPLASMHSQRDCTHYCYSPFVYGPAWQSIGAALDSDSALSLQQPRPRAIPTTRPFASRALGETYADNETASDVSPAPSDRPILELRTRGEQAVAAACPASLEAPAVAFCVSGTARTFLSPLVTTAFFSNWVAPLSGLPAAAAASGGSRLFLHLKSADSGKAEGALSFTAHTADAKRLAEAMGRNEQFASMAAEAVVVAGIGSANAATQLPLFAVVGRKDMVRWRAFKSVRCVNDSAGSESVALSPSGSCCRGHTKYLDRADNEERLLHQFLGWRWCMAAIQRHEARSGRRFDLVAFTRPDMVWWRPVTPWCAYSLHTHMLSCNAAGCDASWVAPREASDHLLALADLHRDCTSNRSPSNGPRTTRPKHLQDDCCDGPEFLFWSARLQPGLLQRVAVNDSASRCLSQSRGGAGSILRSASLDVVPLTMCELVIRTLNVSSARGTKTFRLANATTGLPINRTMHNWIFAVCDLVLSPWYSSGRHAWDLERFCGLGIRSAQELRAMFPPDHAGRKACLHALPIS